MKEENSGPVIPKGLKRTRSSSINKGSEESISVDSHVKCPPDRETVHGNSM